MNWRKSPIFKSFGVQGCLIEPIYASNKEYLILFDNQEIRIYNIQENNQEIDLNLYDSINLYSKIQEIIFYQCGNSKYLIVMNDQEQVSAISPNYPYEHKLIPIPDNFYNVKLHQTQYNTQFLIQSGSDVAIYELNNKKEFAYQLINNIKQGGQLMQIESHMDGTLFFLTHSYYHEETPLIQAQLLQKGFTSSIGLIKSTITYTKIINNKKMPLQQMMLKFVVLQILALDMDQIIILTNKALISYKSGNPDLRLQFQQEIPDNAFMIYSQQTQQIFICYSPIIEVIQLSFFHFGLYNFQQVQPLTCPGVKNLVVKSINSFEEGKQFTLVWMQTESGPCFLNYIQIKEKNSLEIEPEIQKKVKLDDYDYRFKIIASFQTFRSIFDFAVMNNQLFILSGDGQQQSVSRVNHEVHLLQAPNTNKLTQALIENKNAIFFDSHIAFIRNKEKLDFYKINKDLVLSLVDTIDIDFSYDQILKYGTINQNVYFINFTPNNIMFIQNNPLSSFLLEFNYSNIKQVSNYFIGMLKNQLVLCTMDLTQKQLIPQLISEQLNERIMIYDLQLYRNVPLIMILSEQKFVLLILQEQKLQIVFQSNDFKNYVSFIHNGAQFNQSLYTSYTCPSVPLQIQFPINFTEDPIVDMFIVTFPKTDSLLLFIVFQQQQQQQQQQQEYIVNIYKLIKQEDYSFKTFKLLFTFKQQNYIYPTIEEYNLNHILIQQMNLLISDIQGDNQIHFIKHDQNPYLSSFISNQNAYLVDNNYNIHQIPIFRSINLPSDNILAIPLQVKDQKQKQIILIQSFNFSNWDYLLLVNKYSFQRSAMSFKNEILIYRSDNLNEVYAELTDLDNEEIIKVAFMPIYELILVMSLIGPCYNMPEATATKVHILKIDSFQKIIELEYKIIKESVPIDLSIIQPYQSVLVLTQDQIKFFDPPIKSKNSSIMSLSLQATEAQKLPAIHYEAVIILDRWIAVLNGGFKIILCKLADGITQPKSEYVTEFGLQSNQKIFDIVFLKKNDKIILGVLDQEFNMHLYQVSKEKNRLKKIGDFYQKNACKIASIGDKILLSTHCGSMYLMDLVDENDNQNIIQYDAILQELPYIGGFNPANHQYARHGKKLNQTAKGCVWDSAILGLLNYLSKPLRKAILKRCTDIKVQQQTIDYE